ncbi:MAG: hypothetical protein IH941_02485 [Acidobacteria bacterium]|nr:hypothetical protein [Acidobacteriota bacterium]
MLPTLVLDVGHNVQSRGLHIRLSKRTWGELHASFDLIAAAVAPPPHPFPVPYGATDAGVFAVAEGLGLEVVPWTVVPLVARIMDLIRGSPPDSLDTAAVILLMVEAGAA